MQPTSRTYYLSTHREDVVKQLNSELPKMEGILLDMPFEARPLGIFGKYLCNGNSVRAFYGDKRDGSTAKKLQDTINMDLLFVALHNLPKEKIPCAYLIRPSEATLQKFEYGLYNEDGFTSHELFPLDPDERLRFYDFDTGILNISRLVEDHDEEYARDRRLPPPVLDTVAKVVQMPFVRLACIQEKVL